MHAGEDRPFISTAAVRACLDNLLYTSTQRPREPLEALALVDEFMANPDLPSMESGRSFAIRHILTDLLGNQYRQIRGGAALPLPPIDTSKKIAEQAITEDARQRNTELISWSVLYHRYVRVDLGLHPAALAELISTDERTVRRYQNHAVVRLTDHLTEMEWAARIRQRRLRLFSRLPLSDLPELIGRQDQLRRAARWLAGDMPRHILLTGVPGIGKTAFAQHVVREQIDQGVIDQLVWIETPESVQYVRQYLHQVLLFETGLALKDYVQLVRLTVVIDEAGFLDEKELDTLLRDLSQSVVFVISQRFLPLINNIHHIPLEELQRDEAAALLRHRFTAERSQNSDESDDQPALDEIYQAVGGNPQALQLAAAHFDFYHSTLTHVILLKDLYERFFESLPESTKLICLVFSLLPGNGYEIDQLRIVIPTISPSVVESVARNRLLQFSTNGDRFSIAPSFRNFLDELIDSSLPTQSLVQQWLDHLDWEVVLTTGIGFALAEHMLFRQRPLVESQRWHNWIQVMLPTALQRREYARWSLILANYLQRPNVDDVTAQLGYAMCIRRLGEWDQAAYFLENVVALCGARGLFLEQGRAVFEQAVLARQRGQYEQALALLRRASGAAERYRDENLGTAVQIERAQIAIDTHDAATALKILNNAPVYERTLLLRSEAALLSSDLRQSRALIEQAIAQAGNDQYVIAKLQAALGRVLFHLREFEAARHYLEASVIVMEQSDDFASLARARSNLAAVLIRLDDYADAERLLLEAEKVQLALSDQVALTATRHNLDQVRRRLSR